MVTNQNQLSNGRPVYTGNQSIWTVYNLHHFTCGLLLFFFTDRNGHKLLRFHCGAQQWKPATSCRSERQKPSSSPICCRSPWGEKRCWFWHSLPVPTNKSCLFFQTCWLRISLERTGEGEEEEEGGEEREGRGGTAPGLEEDIVCMCTQAQGLWPAA